MIFLVVRLDLYWKTRKHLENLQFLAKIEDFSANLQKTPTFQNLPVLFMKTIKSATICVANFEPLTFFGLCWLSICTNMYGNYSTGLPVDPKETVPLNFKTYRKVSSIIADLRSRPLFAAADLTIFLKILNLIIV